MKPRIEHRIKTRLVEAVLAAAQGDLTSRAEQSAAVQFGVGLLERCFALAEIAPESLSQNAITPLMLSRSVRQLLLTGDSVSAIDTSVRRTALVTCCEFRHSRRRPGIVLALSSRVVRPQSADYSSRLPSTSVVHVRIGSSVQQPWKGVSPLINAGLSASQC